MLAPIEVTPFLCLKYLTKLDSNGIIQVPTKRIPFISPTIFRAVVFVLSNLHDLTPQYYNIALIRVKYFCNVFRGIFMFAQKVKDLLRERHETWSYVSDKLDIGRNQLYYWALNKTVPRMDTVEKLSTYFGVSVDYLLGNEEKMEEVYEILSSAANDMHEEYTEQEKALIEMFRKASPENKLHIIHDVVEWSKK